MGTPVLTHQVPIQTPDQAQTTYLPAISASFDGEIVVAEDGTRVTLDL